MKNIKFHKTFFQNHQPSVFKHHRAIHITNTYIAQDKNMEPVVCILETRVNRQQDESREDYDRRSKQELGNAIPSSMKDKPMLMLKVNETVIYPADPIKKLRKTIGGHVAAALIDNNLDIKVALSKIPQPVSPSILDNAAHTEIGAVGRLASQGYRMPAKYEDESELAASLITQNDLNEKKGSSEKFIFINLHKTNFTAETFKQRVSELTQEKNPIYDRMKSACCQAVTEVLIGLKEANIATQTAAKEAILGIINPEEVELIDNLKSIIGQSGLHLLATQVGEKAAMQSQLEAHDSLGSSISLKHP